MRDEETVVRIMLSEKRDEPRDPFGSTIILFSNNFEYRHATYSTRGRSRFVLSQQFIYHIILFCVAFIMSCFVDVVVRLSCSPYVVFNLSRLLCVVFKLFCVLCVVFKLSCLPCVAFELSRLL